RAHAPPRSLRHVPPPATPASLTILFFFSSRRRHTRSDRDWSSDVCSSDLLMNATPSHALTRPAALRTRLMLALALSAPAVVALEIGRASCRERVWGGVGGGVLERGGD